MNKLNYQALCNQFYLSDLSMTDFCRQNEVPFSSFREWYYRICPSLGIIFDNNARQVRIKGKAKKTNVARDYPALCNMYYQSDKTMRDFCREQEIPFYSFKEWYYRIAPSRGIVFDNEARRKRRQRITRESTLLKLETKRIKKSCRRVKADKVRLAVLKLSPFERKYKEIAFEVISLIDQDKSYKEIVYDIVKRLAEYDIKL